MKIKKFTYQDLDGQSLGIVSTEQLWANVYALKYNRPEQRLNRDIWNTLFQQAKEAAVAFGAGTIVVRLRKEYEPELFRNILARMGLKKISERIEFQREVALLPDESGSPLQWKTAKDLNWNTADIAHFTRDITKNALDIDPDEKPEDFIQDWLHHAEFTHGPGCIAVGFIANQPCALVVAQINAETGWSRLSYLGILPEFRGKGLGKWVHRHGFKMLKDQGGKLYHGGTHGENWPMRRLFESHGCQQLCEMEEWALNLQGGL